MRRSLFLIALALPTAAAAEVVSADPHGFEVRHSVSLPVPPPQAFAAFGQVERWWSKAHSFSGDASRLSLQLRPGGCFCERLDGGGGVEHLRIAFLQPGERIILTGALGPLLFEAVNGTMDIRVEPMAGGSRLTLAYRASGFARSNGDKLAPLVDSVLGEQVGRLAKFAATRAGARR
jgi:uncharacterized protein YndB with AHSA1/START domain